MIRPSTRSKILQLSSDNQTTVTCPIIYISSCDSNSYLESVTTIGFTFRFLQLRSASHFD